MNARRNELCNRPECFVAAIFLAWLVSGCGGILGIDGLDVGCVEGDKRCADSNAIEVCNAFGTWETLEMCVGRTCIAGACLGECASGQEGCDGKTPKTCNAEGLWVLDAACAYACLNGKCDCDPGQTRCIGNTFGMCGDHRAWKDTPCWQQTCFTDPKTLVSACTGQCAPGTRCVGDTPQACDAMGQWQDLSPCSIDEQCKAGACVEACSPKSKRCFENRKQTCNDDGVWQDDIGGLCVDSTCDPDTVECVGTCAPGATQCKGATPQSCGTKGQWQDEPTCTIACVAGQCTDCLPGEMGCYGNTPQTCSIDGYWEAAAACVETTCVTGVCQGACAPGKRCLGNTPQSCNGVGQWESSTPCDPGQVCFAGTCNCIEGDRRCFDNTPQLCDGSNQWVDDGAPCTGQTCDPDVATCVGVCEPGQIQCFDANTAQHCDPKGQWETTATCTLGCIAQQCASCPAGEKQCTGNTPQTCSAGGQWQDDAECVELTCVDGTCLGECAAGSARCAGNWPQTCDPVGVWQYVGQPCFIGTICYHGQCEASCTPGAKRCAGDYPQTCDGNGVWQSDGAPCAACIACDAATGMCETNSMPVDECNEPIRVADARCALFPNGKIKCWGVNEYGQLGFGDTFNRGDQPGEMGANLPFVDLGIDPGVTVDQVSAADMHTCALTSDGRVKCWGLNLYGSLGLDDTNHRGDEPDEMGASLPFVNLGLAPGVAVLEISAGSAHTCALTSDGNVKCWGGNYAGQLGLGDSDDRGDQAGEMGANLPFVDLGLPAGVTTAHINTGGEQTCALTSDGRIKCWGNNWDGRLGLGDTSTRGNQPGQMGTNLPFVNLGLDPGVTVVKMSMGYRHNCVLTSDDRIKCWGGNADGQLGLGDTKSRGTLASQMGASLPFVNLGLPAGERPIDIRARAYHTCAHTSNGHIKCWGWNAHGELGLGDTQDRGDQAGEMGTSLPFVNLGLNVTVAAISAGRYSNCALLVGGSVKCWGDNTKGRLGLGDAFHRGDDLDEMGDNLPTLEF